MPTRTAMKAEPLTTTELDRWLAGKRPRRILVAPFYGPIPGADGKGRDLDREYFHPGTDFYGPYAALKASRERLTDWHHVTFGNQRDPAGDRMKGAVIGHVVLDEQLEDDGLWADFWANAGERRRNLVAILERRNVPLYGSSQAVAGGIQKGRDGAIDVWPIYRHTITTAPQNTYAIVPALKASLTANSLDEIPAGALKALLVGLDPEQLDLLGDLIGVAASPAALIGEAAVAKAGRVLSAKNALALRAALDALAALVGDMTGTNPPPVRDASADGTGDSVLAGDTPTDG